MPPPPTVPAATSPNDDVGDVPDAVPADVARPHDPDKPIGSELCPKDAMPETDVLVLVLALSKVDVEPTAPDVPELATPAPKQGSALAVG
jgi:hypothetical protein